MPTVNEMLLDEAIRHQVALAKYSNNVVRRIMALLNRSDARLFAELTAALERLDPASFTVERLESMLASVRSINAQAYALVGRELRRELQEFVTYEAAYQAQMLTSILPAQVHVASVSAEAIYTAAMARPFQGTLLKGALDHLESEKARKIRRTIAQGYVEARTTSQIVQEIRGTRARGYADGLMEGTRREIEAITRTAMGHMAGFTQDRYAEANQDILKGVMWDSTIDLRTSSGCRLRDKKLYHPVTHKPIGHSIPWLGGPGRLHWNCRSAQVFVTKSLRDMGIDMDDLSASSTRATMDGQIPADVSYGEWLKKQSYDRQVEVLGPTRAKLMRDGDLPMDRMYGQKGEYLTLDQLRERDAAAFRKAGI